MSNGSDSSVYAAAQGREYLRNELSGKSNEFIREFAGYIDDPDTLDLLNYYSSLWHDEPEDFIDTTLGQEILQSASTKMANEAFHDGNVSALQGMVGLSSNDQDGEDILTKAAKELQHEGAIGLILGPPGAGKTATTLDVSRVWAALTGGRVIGNTSWDGFDAVVSSDKEMLEDMAAHEGPVLAVLDETAQDLSGFGSDNTKAEQFANALTFIRKSEESHGPHAKRGSVLMVNHTRKRTAAPFRRLSTFALEKPSRSDPGRVRLLETEGGKDKFEEGSVYTGLTDTRETYKEHEASEFNIVLDSDDDQEESDGVSNEDVAWSKDCETAIRRVLAGDSQSEAANYTDWSRGWVGERWREWKEGEHRDLVAVPPELPDHVNEDEVVIEREQ